MSHHALQDVAGLCELCGVCVSGREPRDTLPSTSPWSWSSSAARPMDTSPGPPRRSRGSETAGPSARCSGWPSRSCCAVGWPRSTPSRQAQEMSRSTRGRSSCTTVEPRQVWQDTRRCPRSYWTYSPPTASPSRPRHRSATGLPMLAAKPRSTRRRTGCGRTVRYTGPSVASRRASFAASWHGRASRGRSLHQSR